MVWPFILRCNDYVCVMGHWIGPNNVYRCFGKFGRGPGGSDELRGVRKLFEQEMQHQ